MKTFLYLALVILSPILYIALSPMVGFYQYYPFIALAGMAVGIVLLLRLMNKKFTKLRLAAVIFSGLFTVLFLWYSLSYSEYNNTKSIITAGSIVDDALKAVRLTSTSGSPVDLGDFITNSQTTLIVLNRGAW